jgi:hypothetical protein
MMFNNPIIAAAEAAARRERREMIWHYTTRLINAEVKLGRNPPHNDEGVKRLVENAARYVDAIFKEANE